MMIPKYLEPVSSRETSTSLGSEINALTNEIVYVGGSPFLDRELTQRGKKAFKCNLILRGGGLQLDVAIGFLNVKHLAIGYEHIKSWSVVQYDIFPSCIKTANKVQLQPLGLG